MPVVKPDSTTSNLEQKIENLNLDNDNNDTDNEVKVELVDDPKENEHDGEDGNEAQAKEYPSYPRETRNTIPMGAVENSGAFFIGGIPSVMEDMGEIKERLQQLLVSSGVEGEFQIKVVSNLSQSPGHAFVEFGDPAKASAAYQKVKDIPGGLSLADKKLNVAKAYMRNSRMAQNYMKDPMSRRRNMTAPMDSQHRTIVDHHGQYFSQPPMPYYAMGYDVHNYHGWVPPMSQQHGSYYYQPAALPHYQWHYPYPRQQPYWSEQVIQVVPPSVPMQHSYSGGKQPTPPQ